MDVTTLDTTVWKIDLNNIISGHKSPLLSEILQGTNLIIYMMRFLHLYKSRMAKAIFFVTHSTLHDKRIINA